MTTIIHDIFSLLKILFAFSILYIIIPSIFITYDEENDSWMDKIFIPIIHSNLVIIVLVHILALCKIYETLSLATSILFIIIIYYKFRSTMEFVKNDCQERNLLARLFDIIDIGRHFFKDLLYKQLIKTAEKVKLKLGRAVIHFFAKPFDGFLLFLPIIFAVYDRFIHAFTYFYYGYFDPYVHLAWIKYLGSNQIYRDGIYPYGYEALISAINKLFFIDPALILRFIGPVVGCMIVFSIYFILKKHVTGSNLVSFFAVAIYVISTELPNNILRQRAALPQEYASVFFFPGIHYLDLFYRTNKKRYLILAAEILSLTLLVHLYAAVFVGIAYVILSVIYINKFFDMKRLISTATFMGLAGVLGLLPVIIALAFGMKFHAMSIQFVEKSISLVNKLDWKIEMFRYTEENPALVLIVICSAIILLFSVIALIICRKSETRAKMKFLLCFSILGILLYTQFRTSEVGYPALVDYARAGVFLAMAGVVVYGLFVSLIEYLPMFKILKYFIQFVIGAYIILATFSMEKFKVMEGYKAEYNQSAYAYYKIKEDYPALNWTLVSPVEQYAYSLGYGWHYNLWEFVNRVVEHPNEKFVFTTDYVFFYIEKVPLNSAKPISIEDANKPFPTITSGYDEYYSSMQKRRIIEAKAYFWLENYMQTHPLKIYYEDEKFKIYMLQQDGSEPLNLGN